jgi:riboflavin synthase
LKSYIIPKGSVALDGVSLTIAAVEDADFSVAFIPTTLENTILSSLAVGDVVNIETDIIARTIIHHLRGMASSTGLTMDALREAGLA